VLLIGCHKAFKEHPSSNPQSALSTKDGYIGWAFQPAGLLPAENRGSKVILILPDFCLYLGRRLESFCTLVRPGD